MGETCHLRAINLEQVGTMSTNHKQDLITSWLSLTQTQAMITNELEQTLQQQHDLSLNEFYVLLFLFEAPEKKLRLQQLQAMVGLSQSAISRLVSRFEAKGCGAMQRAICENDRRGYIRRSPPLVKTNFNGQELPC